MCWRITPIKAHRNDHADIRIPALVVTFDGHREFLQNMLASYTEHWPLHPFQFYVPYNGEFPSDMMQLYGDFVTLVKTPVAINETVLNLLDACGCLNKIVFFAMDDYYISSVFNYEKLELAMLFVRAQLENPRLLSFTIAYTEGLHPNGTPSLPVLDTFLFPDTPEAANITDTSEQPDRVRLGRLRKRPPTNVMVWSHSFWRASFIHDLYVQGSNISEWYHVTHGGQIANRWDDLLTTDAFRDLIELGWWDIFRLAEPVLQFQESAPQSHGSRCESILYAISTKVSLMFCHILLNADTCAELAWRCMAKPLPVLHDSFFRSTHVGKVDPLTLADLDRRGISLSSKFLPPSTVGSGRWGGKW